MEGLRRILTLRNASRHVPEAGAVCGSSARTDLCGGWQVTAIPTATEQDKGAATSRAGAANVPGEPVPYWYTPYSSRVRKAASCS
ncbi:hypothetical protein D3879_24900 [Pseudomonas cavernicola]|uniref:Uncharacterized protein n=1 Tax=Pseudomonas cavernicola TaxID=2320866 RepID=A0A418X991_9PSED|nr:hypothetical protein D3879_24900 [Pseudomonas cavernicola]